MSGSLEGYIYAMHHSSVWHGSRNFIFCYCYSCQYDFTHHQLLSYLLICAVGSMKEFRAFLTTDNDTVNEIKELSQEVEKFAAQFPMPGIDDL